MTHTTSMGNTCESICACACHSDGVRMGVRHGGESGIIFIGDALLLYLSTYMMSPLSSCSTVHVRCEHGQRERQCSIARSGRWGAQRLCLVLRFYEDIGLQTTVPPQ